MKIRNGFISNSSSSSFVIPHPKGEELTKASLHRAIFGTDVEQTFLPIYRDELIGISSETVVNWVFDSINDTVGYNVVGKLNTTKAQEIFGSICPPGINVPETHFKNNKGEIDWDEHQKLQDKAGAILTAKIIMKMRDMDFYVAKIEDDSAIGSEIEHGPALQGNPDIIRISNH